MDNMAIGGFVAGMILLVLAAIVVVILAFVFWILMIIDCVKRDFKKDNEKVVWILVIVLLGFIGAFLIYIGTVISYEGRLVKPDLCYLKKNDIYEVVGVVRYADKFITVIRDRKGKIRVHHLDKEPPPIFKFVDGKMVEYPLVETKPKGPAEIREIA